MERLTKRTHRGTVYIKGTVANYSSLSYDCKVLEGSKLLEEALKKLGDYEDAEENGLLVRLPCKAGDTVYKVFENIFHYGVLKKPFRYSDIDEIGKTVFLTQKEAEAKLKEMEG